MKRSPTRTKPPASRSTSMKKCADKVGTKATEYDQAKEEIGAHFKKVDQRLDGMINAVNTAVSKAQAEGAQGTELEETKQNDPADRRLAAVRAQQNLYFVA